MLSGLDTTVVSSPVMVRALTEPFGHVVELFHPDKVSDPSYGGHAAVVYCCLSSASLARLALHGLVVGKSQVQASLGHLIHQAGECVSETGPAALSASTAAQSFQPHSQEVMMSSSRLHRTSSATRALSSQAASFTGYSSFAEGGGPGLSQQSMTRPGSTHLNPWRNSNLSESVAPKEIHNDPILGERVSWLQFRLGERHCRTAFKTKADSNRRD